MTDEHAELIQKLAMSLDTCMDIVAAEARKEKRAGEGKSIRPITWQDREQAFARLVKKARDTLTQSDKIAYF